MVRSIPRKKMRSIRIAGYINEIRNMNKRPIKKIKCELCGEVMKADKKIEHLADVHGDPHARAVIKELENLE